MSQNQVTVVDLLYQLLLDEYLQRDVYETYSYYLFGLASPALQEHLKEHRDEEDKHIEVLQRYLMGFGAPPLLERSQIPEIDPPIREILKYNLQLEIDAVEGYAKAIEVLDNLGENGDRARITALRVDLENILVQEQEHLHDLTQWLKSDTGPPQK